MSEQGDDMGSPGGRSGVGGTGRRARQRLSAVEMVLVFVLRAQVSTLKKPARPQHAGAVGTARALGSVGTVQLAAVNTMPSTLCAPASLSIPTP